MVKQANKPTWILKPLEFFCCTLGIINNIYIFGGCLKCVPFTYRESIIFLNVSITLRILSNVLLSHMGYIYRILSCKS